MSNEELLQRIIQLEMVIASLRNGSSIPFDIGTAFGDRLGAGFKIESLGGGQSAQSVNEGGSATYSVSALMDGTAPAIFNGTQIYIPFYV